MIAASLRDVLRGLPIARRTRPLASIGPDFAREFAGVPANSRARSEEVVEYTVEGEATARVLLGVYGDEDRVRGWLPGYPPRMDRMAAAELVGRSRPPVRGSRAARSREVDLRALPVFRVTDRDAGPYLTLGVVHARDEDGCALSVHRMLVLDHNRLTVWMVPGRGLAELHARALRRGRELAVSVNIGAPPAAVVASAVNGRFLPPGVSKLDLAGALAGAPLRVASAETQPVEVLADAEIVLEGTLGPHTADEALGGEVRGSMPEFLGYDGAGRPDLPVLTVSGMSLLPGAHYQAVIGPGREQSVILGLGGALSVALSARGEPWEVVRALHFGAWGGGMVVLAVALRKTSAVHDEVPALLAPLIFAQHPFVKLIVFADDDVDVRCAEDLWWAVATRTNLAADCVTLPGYPAVPMVPSEHPAWRPTSGRSYVDATVPFRARALAERSLVAP
ncbi:UbiD family decarboxylase domain-containing protein [Saccharopolyspora sp. 5N708]|uniref:UbiD family decarboxylase domain-containing protein n=1 Tax=Saccharopolyspora sp. 5N708 TaxID=3457424 RepID=UPI003FD591BC